MDTYEIVKIALGTEVRAKPSRSGSFANITKGHPWFTSGLPNSLAALLLKSTQLNLSTRKRETHCPAVASESAH